MKNQHALAPVNSLNFGGFYRNISSLQSTLDALVDAQKSVTPVYYIDDCQVSGDNIDISYTLNDNWADTILSMNALKSFVTTTGMNDYCFDSSINGCHVQDSGSLDLDTFIAENLFDVVGAYLKAKRIGQNVN